MLPEYLKATAIQMKPVTEYEDFSDLEPLREMLAGVNIVGLGESTHGTREFFQLKHRITRFLVEKMGYRAFTIEAGVLPCLNINDYIEKGKGDRAKALASQGYWTWDTEEVTDLIEWLRQHNLSCERGAECRFIGYDVKPIPEAVRELRRIIGQVDESAYKRTDAILTEIENIPFPCRDADGKTLDDALWLLGYVCANEIMITEKLSSAAYELALKSARFIYQYMDSMIVNHDGYAARDYHMAENISFIMNSLPKDSKIVVWAHNAHIAVNDDWNSMGYWLRRRFGDRYFPFALTFTRGQFQSRIMKEDGEDYKFGPLIEFDAPKPMADFWERDLMEINGDYYLNLRCAIQKDEDTRVWALNNNYQLFGAGGGYIPILPDSEKTEFFDRYILGKHFDGLFHIEKTTRAIPTPTGRRDEGSPVR